MVSDNYPLVHQTKSSELSANMQSLQWSILSKAIEFFCFWFIVIIIVYGFATAVLLYSRNEEAIRRIKESMDSGSNAVNSSNQHTLCDGELYPTIRLSGGHECHYLMKVDHNSLTAQQTELRPAKIAYAVEEQLSMRPGKRSDIVEDAPDISN
ncbi:hypothetical protein HG536_0E03480 [Torulaspora globosa]|uniref:Uncharacterized protein n=1 Tax=Torulaspora globosa TaxID=48254 RepID=A0A7G3ZIV1_9SACH|nr:uncharacterized protein HG536_0E03480 [Torulaspora globosa]QLL33437.1 hypothetical protein HG536_0E03480 [Torulaspora globosa]